MATRKPLSLEIAIFNAASALIAYTSGADRLELCAEGSFHNGGTTPSMETLREVISSLQRAAHDNHIESDEESGNLNKSPLKPIPIYAMIRPRGGDFVYSADEFEIMKQQLLVLKNENYNSAENGNDTTTKFDKISGFVFGILSPTASNRIDQARNEELVRLAAPLPCTFHRAFDEAITSICGEDEDQDQDRTGTSNENSGSGGSSNSSSIAFALPNALRDELEAVIQAGFASILTSGGVGRSALQGAHRIAALTKAAEGRIEVIAGGGVRSKNIPELRRASSHTCFFHSSAIVDDVDGRRHVVSRDEVRALKGELVVST